MEALRGALLAWYDAHARDLPWRRAPDPYAVLVSEFMLQQTRVETVLLRFVEWMQRFPTVGVLANASEDDVMAAWSGLGYYRRAVNLHRAAQEVAANGWPDDLRALPGVGDYTAGAVASIAFGRPVPAVDANAVRVMARLGAIEADVDRAPGKKAVQALAASLVAPARPGDWNQAVMELGARICKPAPRCDACPVQAHCAAHGLGIAARLPRKQPTKPPVHEDVHFGLADRDGAVWLTRRPPGLLAGTWALPELDGPPGPPIATARHQFTHRTWDMHLHAVAPVGEGRWVAIDSLPEEGLSTAMRKALRAAGVPA